MVPTEKEKLVVLIVKSMFLQRTGPAFLTPALAQRVNLQMRGGLDSGTVSS